jgi:hypothetical protein
MPDNTSPRTTCLILASLVLFACGLFVTPNPTPTPIQPTDTPPPTPTSTFTLTPSATPTPTNTPLPTLIPPDSPAEGTSNVYGRVLFRGKPAAAIRMNLNNLGVENRIELYYESIATGNMGEFYFTSVPAGDYTLEARIPDDSRLNGVAGEYQYTFSVPENTNFNYGDYRLLETDLTLLSPQHESVLGDTPESLQWQPYTGAAYYRVLLLQTYGSYTDLEVRTEETQLILTQPLMSCEYIWAVTAFDSSGAPLASSTGDSSISNTELVFSKSNNFASANKEIQRFTIENDMLPWCHIATNIKIESNRVAFDWELHPLADRYRLYVERSSGNLFSGTYRFEVFYDEYIDIDQDGAPKTSSVPTFRLGYYYTWRIYAVASDGGILAAGNKSFDTRGYTSHP